MKVVQIEDGTDKRRDLARRLRVDEVCRDPKELDEFLKTSHLEPGVAVVDVGDFVGFGKEHMLKVGERLADQGWQVIFWSISVEEEDVRDDCWYTDDRKGGAAAIAIAVKGGPAGSELRRGRKRNDGNLILQFLSALLPFGLLWEASGRADDSEGLRYSAASLDDGLFAGVESVFARRFKSRVQPHTPPGADTAGFEREVSTLDGLLSGAATDPAIGPLWDAEGVAPPSDVDAALDALAGASSLTQWNGRLAALRESLLRARP